MYCRGVDPRYVDLLRELAERGSITGVANATHLTPSAVSQQLRAAQREFGAALFEPVERGLRLTEAGRLLADSGAAMVAALERVQAGWDDLVAGPTGTVSITAPPSAATFLFAGILGDLADTAIELVLRDDDPAEAELAEVMADIVIVHGLADETDGFVATRLADEPLDIAMAADHELADRKTVTSEDVIAYEWIGHPFDAVLESIEQATSTTPVVVQRFRDDRLIESIVASGRRLAALPRFTTPTDTGLVLRPLSDIPSTRTVSALVSSDKADRPAVQRVLRALRRVGADVERRHRS